MISSLIVIVYVDNILVYGWSKDEIDDFIEQMKTEDVALNKEGTAEGYLGGRHSMGWKTNNIHSGWADKKNH
jgi:hypothetical protein